jgi:hypothetical protein
MIWENSHGHRMAQSVIVSVPVGQTQTKSNVRVTSVWLPNVLQTHHHSLRQLLCVTAISLA